jgi:hypothetical protein
MVEVAPRLFLLIVHVIIKLVGRLGLGLPGYLETSAPAEELANFAQFAPGSVVSPREGRANCHWRCNERSKRM